MCFLDAPGGRKSAIPNILPSDLSKSVFNPYQSIPLGLHKSGCQKYDRGELWISACIACHIIDFTCKSPIEYGCLVLCAVLCRQRAGAGWAAPVFKTIESSSCNSNIVWNLYSVRTEECNICNQQQRPLVEPCLTATNPPPPSDKITNLGVTGPNHTLAFDRAVLYTESIQ